MYVFEWSTLGWNMRPIDSSMEYNYTEFQDGWRHANPAVFSRQSIHIFCALYVYVGLDALKMRVVVPLTNAFLTSHN